MSLLEIKQHVSSMSRHERQELHEYLIRLKHETPEWKRTTARRLKAVGQGKFATLETLETRAKGG